MLIRSLSNPIVLGCLPLLLLAVACQGPEGPAGNPGPPGSTGSYTDTLGYVSFVTTGNRLADDSAFSMSFTCRLAAGEKNAGILTLSPGHSPRFSFVRTAYADAEFNGVAFSITTDPSFTQVISAHVNQVFQQALPGNRLFQYRAYGSTSPTSGGDQLTITNWAYDQQTGYISGTFTISGSSNSTQSPATTSGSFRNPVSLFYQ